MGSEKRRIYLQHPEKEGELLPAQLIKEEDGVLSVRLLEELLLPANLETKQFFHDQHELFHGFSCQVLRMESGGPNPVVSLVQTGPKERYEKRDAFRVPIYDGMVKATFEEQFEGPLFDISYGGIAAVIDHGDYGIDRWLPVELEFDCETVAGSVQVRSRLQLKDGRFRYGLLADPSNHEFARFLEATTQAVQNLKARRASRLGTNNLGITRPVYADEVEEEQRQKEQASSDAPGQPLEGDPSLPGGQRRQHDRKAWTGPAKVYILEERQLRVIEVETQDLSQGGLSFSCKPYIYEGTELLFEKPMPGGMFRVCASVCSSHMKHGLHRVGVKFVGVPLKPGETHPRFYMV